MIVVADASPLNYLIQISCEELLEKLYGRVFVPKAVIEELAHVRAPSVVASWLSRMPVWIEVRSVTVSEDVSLRRLGPGERAAITLAEEIRADLLLIDERDGRSEAKKRGILTIGTLGILLAAGKKGLTNPQKALERLIAETTFRAGAEVIEHFHAYCKSLDE
jgi:predicted nucleic acid-binding protein